MPGPECRVADTHRLAGRLERITLVDDQSHRVSLKLVAVRLPTSPRLLVHSADLLREPLFRLPPLSESRELSQNQACNDRLPVTASSITRCRYSVQPCTCLGTRPGCPFRHNLLNLESDDSIFRGIFVKRSNSYSVGLSIIEIRTQSFAAMACYLRATRGAGQVSPFSHCHMTLICSRIGLWKVGTKSEQNGPCKAHVLSTRSVATTTKTH
jgi:hypothetical protein